MKSNNFRGLENTELTVERSCSGKHVIEIHGYAKQHDGDYIREKQ